MKSAFIFGLIEDYAEQHTSPEPALLTELAERTYAEMERPQMLTGRVEGRFLKLLVALVRPRLIVEIGTFTGYSALSMAEALPPEGRIISCEIDPKAQAMAKSFFARSSFGEKIEIRMGAALETLAEINETIDFAFIDADKENYLAYYQTLIDKMRPGGLMVFDNALWSGEVLAPRSEAAKTIAALNEALKNDDRVETVLLTVRDGMQIARKRE